MCGIAGIVGPGADRHRHLVEIMLDSLVHRGPDQRGVWADAGAVLGCARLAVIDPAGGTQPLVSADGGIVVVGNGEIYGHETVRARFPHHAFGSGSDLEVVIPLTERYGDDVFEHLPGTFALAVYEPAEGRLRLGRDAFGERPLYWAPFDGGVAFASEPQALLAAGIVERSMEPDVLADMLRLGYVPPGRCIWRGMRSLGPGRQITRDRRGRLSEHRWWTPPDSRSTASPGGVTDAGAWLRSELDRAVGEQLVADVPVGLFLSGGMDSSAVTIAAAGQRSGLTAFAFDMPTDSEFTWAERVADRHGVQLRRCVPDEDRVADDLVAASRSWAEPLGDSSSLVTWMLARRARDEVTVVLTGDGADELLGGYAVWARDALAAVDEPSTGRRWSRRGRGRGRPGPAGSPIARAYRSSRSSFDPASLARLGLPPKAATDVDVSAYRWGDVEDICRFDLDWYLPGDILVKTDRASMAHSLEVRAPFLDRRVAEGCLRLPPAYKIDATRQKIVLQQAFARDWPDGLTDRVKQGFGAPIDRWLALPAVADVVGDLLVDPGAPIYEHLEHQEVQAHLAAGGQPAWSLLAVALWWDHHGTPCRR